MASIMDGTNYLYAEELQGKSINLTIDRVVPAEITGENGRKSLGFEVHFQGHKKPHAFTCVTNRRSLIAIFGTGDYTQYAGKRVQIYPVEVSCKAGKLLAIRYRKATDAAPAATAAGA